MSGVVEDRKDNTSKRLKDEKNICISLRLATLGLISSFTSVLFLHFFPSFFFSITQHTIQTSTFLSPSPSLSKTFVVKKYNNYFLLSICSSSSSPPALMPLQSIHYYRPTNSTRQDK